MAASVVVRISTFVADHTEPRSICSGFIPKQDTLDGLKFSIFDLFTTNRFGIDDLSPCPAESLDLENMKFKVSWDVAGVTGAMPSTPISDEDVEETMRVMAARGWKDVLDVDVHFIGSRVIEGSEGNAAESFTEYERDTAGARIADRMAGRIGAGVPMNAIEKAWIPVLRKQEREEADRRARAEKATELAGGP